MGISGNEGKAMISYDGIIWENVPDTPEIAEPVSTYGLNVFVVAGRTNVGYSSDFVNWTVNPLSLTSYDKSDAIVYNDGKFVIFNGENYRKSADLENWTTGTITTAPFVTVDAAYGNGRYVGISNNGPKSVMSFDGETWQEGTLPSAITYTSISYGNGYFIAFGYGTNKCAISVNGLDWTEKTIPATGLWNSTFGEGKFVAINESISNTTIYSDDNGETWNLGGNLPSVALWTTITYFKGKFVAVPKYGTTTTNPLIGAISYDGITWSSMTLSARYQWGVITARPSS